MQKPILLGWNITHFTQFDKGSKIQTTSTY